MGRVGHADFRRVRRAHGALRCEDPGDTHELKDSCRDAYEQRRDIDPLASPDYWMCISDSYVSDPSGESAWHYELRVRVRKSDARVDLMTLSCPGA